VVGFARSVATKQTYGARSENGEGRAPGRRVTVATEKTSTAAKSGSRNSAEKVSNKFLPRIKKLWQNFRTYRACRELTLPSG